MVASSPFIAAHGSAAVTDGNAVGMVPQGASRVPEAALGLAIEPETRYIS
jgi:hypothetical protein